MKMSDTLIFPRHVEDLYFVDMDAFSHVVIAETYVFNPFFV